MRASQVYETLHLSWSVNRPNFWDSEVYFWETSLESWETNPPEDATLARCGIVGTCSNNIFHSLSLSCDLDDLWPVTWPKSAPAYTHEFVSPSVVLPGNVICHLCLAKWSTAGAVPWGPKGTPPLRSMSPMAPNKVDVQFKYGLHHPSMPVCTPHCDK